MDKKQICERELRIWIDSMVDEMNERYRSNLTDEARIEGKLNDIRFREELLSQIGEEIRCKKISERFMDEQSKEVIYNVNATIKSGGLEYSIKRNGTI